MAGENSSGGSLDAKSGGVKDILPVPFTKKNQTSIFSPGQIRPIAVLLFAVVAGTFLPSLSNGFVNFDDDFYVTANTHVQQGLTWESIKWTLHCLERGVYWHPLTWLSHMLDCQLFGLNPWGHHLTALLIHALNTVLLFLALSRMTRAVGRSLFVAALFGLHPLHVETVAWVAERKGVLSTFFWLLTMLAYARYCEESKVQSSSSAKAMADRPKSKVYYWLTLFCFTLGLMSKPMLVTLPFVLLLMDYWPLRRIYDLRYTIDEAKDLKGVQSMRAPSEPGTEPVNRESQIGWRQLIWEKVPLFLLAVVISVVSCLAQKGGGAQVADIPLATRIENAPVACCRYIGQLFYPANICVVYPQPDHWPKQTVVLACLLLLVISAFAFTMRRRCPYLLVGWLWFLGTLAPVIGFIQVGWAGQSMADRYTYVSLIGLFIALAWGACDLTALWRHQFRVLSAAAVAVLLLFAALTIRQITYWQDSGTLFRHAIAVTENNWLACNNLGFWLLGNGEPDEGINQYRLAIKLKPDYALAHGNLAAALEGKGLVDEAIAEYHKAISSRPDNATTYYNLALALQRLGRLDEAIAQYQQAIRLQSDYVDARNNLAVALYQKGRMEEAIGQFQQVVRLKPDFSGAHCNLGNVLLQQSRLDEAASQFQEAVRLDPNNGIAHQNLGDILAKQGKAAEAEQHHQEAFRLMANSPH